ncbi:MAG: serine proteinase [Firmicutes bacterium]|nr:serine proteinase [Bacillota bacterium]
MADWNTWKEKALNLTRTGVGKAKVLGEIARLNLDNLSEEEKIKKAYIEMGERYMSLHQDAPEEGYEVMVQNVRKARENIAANKEKIAKLKAEEDLTDDDLKEVIPDIALDAAAETKTVE